MRVIHDHAATVMLWIAGSLAGKPAAQMVQALEEAFGAMWRRAEVTLGEVTLMAITDRVLHDAVGRFPILAPLKLSAAGLDTAALRESAADADVGQLQEAIHFMLAQFLTVLGNLTADILTRALYAVLVMETERHRGRGDAEGEQP